jgi:carbon-monoxide dehydrogenase medium subunit
MKPARFDYERPATLDEAVALLETEAGAEGRVVKCLAGGQSLGPMLNLRLVQPDLLVDITRVPELTRVEADGDWLVLGACTTHAAIEDGRMPDLTGGVLPAIAAGIAYRAVRTRGTIGGSLAHADPAADWISALAVLGAEVVLYGSAGRRNVPVVDFMTGVFETALRPGEVLEAVRVPRLGPSARWGYYKVCRKTGEFAQAIGALLHDPEHEACRAAVGATDGRPIVLENAGALFGGDPTPPLHERFDRAAARDLLRARGLGGNGYGLQIHAVALERAVGQIS